MNYAALFSALLGAIVIASLVTAAWTYQDRLDAWDRFLMCGLAGSMLMTTPAIWIDHTPFDGWSFNLSRAFLAGFCVKRFVVPVIWEFKGRKRRAQHLSGLHDRMRDKL